MDSIMANPMKRVRLIVLDASGCWAREVKAAMMARLSPKAGAMAPIAIVRLAAAMEVMPIIVELSIGLSIRMYCFFSLIPGCGCNENGRQNSEDVRLDDACEQVQGANDHREKEWSNREQDACDHRPA